MKKIFTILVILISTANVNAQAPQRMSYQTVIRNANNILVANSPVGIKISILQGTTTGSPVYVETQTPSTNANGLVSLQIGGGTVVSGSFSTIDWASGPYFVRTETDITGGTNYTLIGTHQLLSVPYALHAATASFVTGGGGSGFTHYVGEVFGGGMVFYVYKDGMGVEHGLIVSLTDISTGATWGLSNTNVPNCESPWNGVSNTSAIINAGALSTDAAGLCDNLITAGYNDWYLPSVQELAMLWNNLYNVNKRLSTIGGATEISANTYWASTEVGVSYAWIFGFDGGYNNYDVKSVTHYVRAVRAF